MIIKSYAKVNLFLYVTGKKGDGYHTLFSLMSEIGLCDEIELKFNRNGISVFCDSPDIPSDHTNLAYIAADMFYKKTSITGEVEIILKKKIPSGAGLGGGSGNAASILKELNSYYDNPLSFEELIGLGLRIGADVPFFLFGCSAIAEGVGEKLSKCSVKKYYVVLIYPGVSVSTGTIFKKLNLTLTKCSKKIKELLLWEKKQKIPFDVKNHLWNDLEIVTTDICPEIDEAKGALIKSGTDDVLMTGSGSAVFGLFDNEKTANEGFEFLNKFKLKSHKNWQIFLTKLK
ncbi:MAG: 4-(cytidine 5'-diphospho)-2-C-methyl-D-erythritol kinase [Desulfobacterales bacterium]|nr:4-(cytidine 5'-diphospho)-2-C-methyl-D-erythritol kinase [Desulfobacterales bacterium]